MLVSMNSKCKNSILKMALGIAILLFIVIIDNQNVFASADFLADVGYGSMTSVEGASIIVQRVNHTDTNYSQSTNYNTYFPNTTAINNHNVFGALIPTYALTNGTIFTINLRQNDVIGAVRPYYALANMGTDRTYLTRSNYYSYLNQKSDTSNNIFTGQYRGIRWYTYNNNSYNETYITGIVVDENYAREYEYLFVGAFFSNPPTTDNGDVIYINSDFSFNNSSTSTDVSSIITKLDNIYSSLGTISGNLNSSGSGLPRITSLLGTLNSLISDSTNGLPGIVTRLYITDQRLITTNTIINSILTQLGKLDNLINVLGSSDQEAEEDPEVNDDILSIENGYNNSSSGLNQGINNMNNSQADIDDIQNNYINNAANGYDSIGDYVYFTEGGLFSALSFISMQLTSIYNLMSSFKVVLTIGMVCGLFIALIGVLKVYRR